MNSADTIIIGGGAAGLFCAANLKGSVIVLERNDRVGRKLSSTGNGQGNVTNYKIGKENYFSSTDDNKIASLLYKYDNKKLIAFLGNIGCPVVFDERGRAYPSGRQASAVTDLLRYKLSTTRAAIVTNAYVSDIVKKDECFNVYVSGDSDKCIYTSKNVVLCTGGKSSKNFGSDGNGYVLAKKAGHTVTPLYPSLVQIKTDTSFIKPLKGIRTYATVSAKVDNDVIKKVTGDVIFTDYGVSGDAIFRLSAFIADKLDKNIRLELDFLPFIEVADIIQMIDVKKKIDGIPGNELLCGIVNNQIGRVILKRAGSFDTANVANTLKRFTLCVTGSIGFDYAQVTKGGVSLNEVSLNMESKKVENLYFAGEILDVDGECGGYNLQWAFSSAMAVANAINHE